jgi:hypothetical protein
MANDSLQKIQSKLNLTPEQASAFKHLIQSGSEMSEFLIKSKKALGLVQRWNTAMIEFILS